MKLTTEQQRLVEDNHNLIYGYLNKKNLKIEEWYDVCAIGLCKAAQTFNAEKGAQFSTYAYLIMQNQVWQESRMKISKKRVPENMTYSYDAEVAELDGVDFSKMISGSENVEDKCITNVIFNDFLSGLNARHRKIMLLRLNGYKQKDICKIVGCSQPQVSRVLEKARKLFE